MIFGTLFFLLAFSTFVALVWSGLELFQDKEDPLGDRLEELQAHAMVASARAPKRKGGGGFVNSFLYVISLIPGGEDWMGDTEKELAQAGIRNRQALARYAIGQMIFALLLLGGMLYMQRGNPMSSQFGGVMVRACWGICCRPRCCTGW